jgi:hypothetical protein
VTDQNDGGGAADEPLPRFDASYYCSHTSVCFKARQIQWGDEQRLWPSNKVLDGNPLFQNYKKPVGLKIFEEKQ